MDNHVIDAKLKLLVYACKETKNFKKLAVSFCLSSVYARPLEFEQSTSELSRLAELLGFAESELVKALMTERSFVWLGHNMDILLHPIHQ